MGIFEESIQSSIPYYLTQEAKEGLIKELKKFPQSTNYYTIFYQENILQGDGWNQLEVLNFEDGQRKKIKGILLTNSCDISLENSRDFPVTLTFAPVIKLENYENKLYSFGIDPKKIKEKLRSIKEQRVSSLFFLPKGGSLDGDYIALLDDIHTMPFKKFESKTDRVKQFTLSQIGFYLFLLKLSIHFCRFHEGILRDHTA
ncbi:hypothetical protein [Pelovirga terrestris]|uniref:Uncharacterized protein n=1 Tax=Pelovirga terrestris TaxID=2771352 RepID=A0A8J6QJV4_9BACT|nr:hypothetical protein [Pelovirga terrestris]MBD1399439.1 hypothetical protein [Pelovirga terrestris]